VLSATTRRVVVQHSGGMGPVAPLVLASGSTYRAAILAEAHIPVIVDPPDIDERALDGRVADLGPEGLAVHLAVAKAEAVASRHPGSFVLAADQVGVLGTDPADDAASDDRPSEGRRWVLLTKRTDTDGAVAQLMSMAATTHRLVNGMVLRSPDGALHTGVDVQTVTMRGYSESEARSYVDRFEPFDTAGSYRIEDGEVMEGEQGPGTALVASVSGEHPSGVVGMPLPLLRRLLAAASWQGPGSTGPINTTETRGPRHAASDGR